MAESIEPPEHFTCPLTMEVMVNPLKNKITGHSFEREAINTHMYVCGKGTCPLTRQPICPSDFVENKALQLEIQRWKEANNLQDNEEEEDDDEDDDEVFLEILKNARKIQQMSASNRAATNSSNDSYHSRLLDLGAKVLRQRDEKISQCVASRRPSQNRPRPVCEIFEMYQ